jgi:hypothetical protein
MVGCRASMHACMHAVLAQSQQAPSSCPLHKEAVRTDAVHAVCVPAEEETDKVTDTGEAEDGSPGETADFSLLLPSMSNCAELACGCCNAAGEREADAEVRAGAGRGRGRGGAQAVQQAGPSQPAVDSSSDEDEPLKMRFRCVQQAL